MLFCRANGVEEQGFFEFVMGDFLRATVAVSLVYTECKQSCLASPSPMRELKTNQFVASRCYEVSAETIGRAAAFLEAI